MTGDQYTNGAANQNERATLRPPEPILVAGLFPQERAGLLGMLDALRPEDWSRPTVCDGWSVKDVAAHLLADDLGRLSRGRDGFVDEQAPADRPLVEFIDRRNGEWVVAARRLSRQVIRELLEWSGHATAAWFATLDPDAEGPRVSWAGLDAAPVWLDLARELTERWHHGEQIREAVGAPSADDPAVLSPVLATFAYALPVTFHDVGADDGTAVTLVVEGAAGGAWSVVREAGRWSLYLGAADDPACIARLGQDDAWRMYTRLLPPDALERRARIKGDPALGRRLLDTVAIIA